MNLFVLDSEFGLRVSDLEAAMPRRSSSHLRKPSLDFSLTGLSYTCMMLFMGLAAINSQANLLFAVFGLMIGVLLVSWFFSHTILRKVRIRRILPDVVVVGQSAAIQYEFENRKRYWPSFSVMVGELQGEEAFTKPPQTYLLHAAAGTKASVFLQVVPKRRGIHHLDRYQLSTSFPFGFIKRAVERSQKDSILVYPPLARVDSKLLSMCLSAERSGARMRPRRGGDDEFYGVKEFRQGENPRWIYWRRSARTGTLVAKEMTHVSPPRLLILVDTFVSGRTPEERAAVERTIAMAASLVATALDQGLAVGLYVWSGDWLMISPSRGKRHARDMMAALARLPLNLVRDHLALQESARQALRTGTTAILFTPHDLEQSPVEQARGQCVLIAAGSEQARRWFHFPGTLDFSQCVPPDQVAEGGAHAGS
jgi:uncharacterized protein (DUF58 family)